MDHVSVSVPDHSSDEHALDFWGHVEDFRKTVIGILIGISIGTVLSLFFYKRIFDLIISPMAELSSIQLVILSPEEVLLSLFKTCLWSGITISSPIWLYFLLKFIAPALNTKERKMITPFLLLSLVFMILGSMFALKVTIPLANEYLNAFNQTLGTNLWTVSNYLNYTFVLLMANAVAFESAVVLMFLVHYKMLSAETMAVKRRGVIVGIFILSAILTPPDVFTQLMMAIPLCVIYEGAIIYGRYFR